MKMIKCLVQMEVFMSTTYTITIQKSDDFNLNISFSDEFKSMSNEDISVALEDCIKALQIDLLLVTNSSV